MPLMTVLYIKWKNAGKGSRKTAVFLVSCITIAILLPNVTTYLSINNLLNQAASISNNWEKASFISGHVIGMTAYGWSPRAGMDYWKFLLTGAGLCGEMAMAGTNLMNAAGLEARRIVFPGEDHSFIEVNIDGDWLIADPGDYGSKLVTRTEMTTRRVGTIGSVSYVAAYTEDSFIELTEQYVNIDTIVIRITRNGKPLACAQVVLKHRFEDRTVQLPCDDRAFHTDINGTVMLRLGKPYYVNKYKGSEEYYWIYVNGQNTNHNVTSTGSGQIQLVEIDLND